MKFRHIDTYITDTLRSFKQTKIYIRINNNCKIIPGKKKHKHLIKTCADDKKIKRSQKSCPNMCDTFTDLTDFIQCYHRMT